MKNFYKELRRRRVFRVTAAYLVAAWVIIEIASVLTDTYNAPDWVLQGFIALLALGLPLSIVLAWAFDLTPDGIVHTDDVDQEEATATTAAKPVHDSSVAVLPLDYYGDGDKEYISEGITEDLTTLLSRTPGLFVIARNSSSRYRGGGVSIRKVGEELSVRYVVEGSVRRMGDHLRINIQLIEASTENHIWAQRFHFAESDLFMNEEDICHRVATQLVSSLEKAESDRASVMPLGKQDSWLLTQQAIHVWWSGPDHGTVNQAFELINEALEKDPEYAYALAFYGFLCVMSVLIGIKIDVEQPMELGMQSIQAALKKAPDDPFVLYYWGVILGYTGNRQNAISALDRAKQANPNNPHIRADLGFFISHEGRFEEGVKLIKSAFLLSPYEPRSYVWHLFLGSVLGTTDPEAALAEYEESLALFSRYTPSLVGKIICLGILGRDEEASSASKQLQEFHPQTSLDDLKQLVNMSTDNEETRAVCSAMLERYFHNESE